MKTNNTQETKYEEKKRICDKIVRDLLKNAKETREKCGSLSVWK